MQDQERSARGLFYELRKLSTGNTILFFVVVIFGVGALGYGVFGLQQHITEPFSRLKLDSKKLAEFLPPTAQQEEELLKTKDTDADGLTDWDEKYLYQTSPYVADTDSDGVSDGDEAKAGTDPNCAKGKEGQCRAIRLVQPSTKISDLFPEFSTSNITLKDKTVQEFRKVLLDQGYDPVKLKAISDQELIIILEETLKIQDEEAKGVTTTPETIGAVDLDQVREFLISLGVPADEVNSRSNQELIDMLKVLK